MKIFIIHRFKNIGKLKPKLDRIRISLDEKIEFEYLTDVSKKRWKSVAEKMIKRAELVIVYKETECLKSKNAAWEIEKAKELVKDVIHLEEEFDEEKLKHCIRSKYHFEEEFSSLFLNDEADSIFKLYKMMNDSSEKLIERRQKMNSFFITVIGSLITLSVFYIDRIEGNNFLVVFGVSVAAIILCYSWKNQIINYGKLNRAKFKVISKLESKMKIRMFDAEWTALGKGLRRDLYREFTVTERYIPYLFMGLVIMLLVFYTCFNLEVFS